MALNNTAIFVMCIHLVKDINIILYIVSTALYVYVLYGPSFSVPDLEIYIYTVVCLLL